MNAVTVPVQQNDHLTALPNLQDQGAKRRPRGIVPPLVLVEKEEQFRLEIEQVGSGDPPSLMLWGEE